MVNRPHKHIEEIKHPKEDGQQTDDHCGASDRASGEKKTMQPTAKLIAKTNK